MNGLRSQLNHPGIMDTIPVLNHMLWKAYSTKKDDDITATRVQKLLYFLHGWYTTITGAPLLDESFVRGKYGPVLPSLEAELARYAGRPIDVYVEQYNSDTGTMAPFFVNLKTVPQFGEILDAVWKQYSQLTTIQLSSLIHMPDSPWDQTEAGRAISTAAIVADFNRRAIGN